MDLQPIPTTSPGLFAVRAPRSGVFPILVNDTEMTIPCTGNETISYIFYAISVDTIPGDTTPLMLYSPHRFVF
jgi:hypothetical protein